MRSLFGIPDRKVMIPDRKVLIRKKYDTEGIHI